MKKAVLKSFATDDQDAQAMIRALRASPDVSVDFDRVAGTCQATYAGQTLFRGLRKGSAGAAWIISVVPGLFSKKG